MHRRIWKLAAVFLSLFLLLSCRVWSYAPSPSQVEATPLPLMDLTATPLVERSINTEIEDKIEASLYDEAGSVGLVRMGNPAGCLGAEDMEHMSSGLEMLAYADTLINLDRSLTERLLTGAWNGYSQRYLYDQNKALMLDVSDVENEYLLQRIMNVIHVAGFVGWLRDSERQEQGRHILALPLLDKDWATGDWAPYFDAYWRSPVSTPEGDTYVRSVLKLPPCAWMVAAGFAPQVDAGWWSANQMGWPDYAAVAQAYLANNTDDANRVARKIDWLGPQLEGASTMCGPLSWSIMNDAGAFLPGIGAWAAGAKTFWLSKPTTNGRPWSLFPPGTIMVYSFSQPLSKFDFSTWPLYPGDFLYTYSAKDGFDHMLVVTEVHPSGEVYTVTNMVYEEKEQNIAIERLLLLNPNDSDAGLIHNEWRDRSNGRTGHAGFDVMRWDWMVKDIQNQPVEYTVLPGDTLGLVSVRWKTPADWIARYNGLGQDASLIVGQLLNIPPNQEISP